jgi:hypothetical protein
MYSENFILLRTQGQPPYLQLFSDTTVALMMFCVIQF